MCLRSFEPPTSFAPDVTCFFPIVQWRGLEQHFCRIPLSDRYKMFRLHKKCFTGAEAVSHVLSFLHSRDDPTYQKAGRENALKLTMQLMKQGMCVSVSGNAPMSDNDTLFRLTDAAYEKTGIEKPTDSGPSNPTSPEPAPLGKALGGSATQLNSPDGEMRNRSQSTSSGTSRFSRLLSWKPGSKGEAVSSPVSRETSTGV